MANPLLPIDRNGAYTSHFGLEIKKGTYSGYDSEFKFGDNEAVGSAAYDTYMDRDWETYPL